VRPPEPASRPDARVQVERQAQLEQRTVGKPPAEVAADLVIVARLGALERRDLIGPAYHISPVEIERDAAGEPPRRGGIAPPPGRSRPRLRSSRRAHHRCDTPVAPGAIRAPTILEQPARCWPHQEPRPDLGRPLGEAVIVHRTAVRERRAVGHRADQRREPPAVTLVEGSHSTKPPAKP